MEGKGWAFDNIFTERPDRGGCGPQQATPLRKTRRSG